MSITHHRPTRSRSQRSRPDHLSSGGQATAEYALVLLEAAAIALLLAALAARSGRIGDLFDAVIDQIIGRVT